jgi:complement component 1 Q subcomponent-binding protein
MEIWPFPFTTNHSIIAMNRLVRNFKLYSACSQIATRSLTTVIMMPAAQNSALGTAFSTKRFFAKAVKLPSLAEVMASEIDHEENNKEVDHELVDIVKEIGKAFKIDTEPGSAIVKLTRQLNNEDITVTWDVQDANDDVENYDSTAKDSGERDFEEEREVEEVNTFGLDFEVTIAKKDSKLVAQYTATDDDLILRNVRYLPADKENSDREYYGGPAFDDLDETVQNALVDFFEKRGINDKLSYFIMAYSREKEQQEYVRWLSNVRDFAETH